MRRGVGRTVTLSDGVYAIALTLLVLTIKIPAPDDLVRPGALGTALSEAWPFLLAYIAAFVTIAVNWLHHHNAFDLIRHVDAKLLWINFLLLFAVSFMPVPTAFYASALTAGVFSPAARAAAVVFVLSSALRSLGWVLLWRHVRRHPECLRDDADPELARPHQRRSALGALLDVAGAVVSFLVPLAAGVLTAALSVVYLRDAHAGARGQGAER